MGHFAMQTPHGQLVETVLHNAHMSMNVLSKIYGTLCK